MAGGIDLVYPKLCLLCHNPLSSLNGQNPLCFHCQAKIQMNRPPFCQKCSRPVENLRGLYCRPCLKTFYYFDQAWAVTLYNETMRKLIHLFKYGNKTSLRHGFLDYLLEFIDTYHIPVEQFDIIIPVPLHPARLRERGYNQSLLIADVLADTYGVPCEPNNFLRIRNTRYQAKLSKKERWTNIQAAFKIKHSSIIRNKNILIIDDLFTTGATLSESARILKAGGCGRVAALTLAITTSPDDREESIPP